MYSKQNLTYVLTILEAIEKAQLYTKEVSDADEFLNFNDQLNFNACQTLLLVIGEESKKIDNNLKEEYTKIPWHLIAGLRNRIAHDYRSINPNISFDIIKNYLNPLKEILIDMLKKIDFEPSLLNKAIGSSHYRHLKYLKK